MGMELHLYSGTGMVPLFLMADSCTQIPRGTDAGNLESVDLRCPAFENAWECESSDAPYRCFCRQDPVRVVSDVDAAARILSEHPGLKKVVLHRISRPAAGRVFRIPAQKGSRGSALPEPHAVYQT